ncbi:hypothetical protein Cni_G09344 [Canna indica]|uniref:Uncharacterized protein n=1 Tax=Canna indica TaxID=4628 RepID=A0AAQ3Q8S4_9LILI|nr:hypothetical protein Cni_G09344 [Canna indica]
MDEREFRRLLDLFPVVRSRNYCASSELSVGSASRSAEEETTEWRNAWNQMDEKDVPTVTENDDPFWEKLRLAAERKVGAEKALKFCEAFQMAHDKLLVVIPGSHANRFSRSARLRGRFDFTSSATVHHNVSFGEEGSGVVDDEKRKVHTGPNPLHNR